MSSKITAAKIAVGCGADMVIANGEDIGNIRKIMEGKSIGTLFPAHRAEENSISSVDTVSFSFTIGITFIFASSRNPDTYGNGEDQP